MKLSDFDYRLPEELIATHPLARRDSSRLLVLGRNDGSIRHSLFPDLKNYLRPGDALVLNDTRVISARLVGSKETGGKVELLLVRRIGASEFLWEALAKSSKGLKAGSVITFLAGVTGRLIKRLGDDKGWLIEFSLSADRDFLSVVEEIGSVPLPPYIRRPAEDLDKARYQTVFAKTPGGVAAPTAGLHFTAKMLSEIEAMGVLVRRVTLHVGPGTFLPVRTENIEEHRMHAERYEVEPNVFSDIMRVKENGGRVVAVGSTAARTLETIAASKKSLDLSGDTSIFIYPGFEFKVVDAMVTNFHLPKSTLMMLVSAFAGRESVLHAYAEAVRERYRFFSYGDAMLII